MVKSVVLAWGSLVWDPRDVQIAAKFMANGPLLPIEFCRISGDGRLTLAIDETFGALCKTYSAPSTLESLDAARDDLCRKEGMADAHAIGFVEPTSGRQSELAMESHPQVVATIGAWAESLGYDAAIWTALQYLETLEGKTPPSSRRRWPTFGKRRPRSRRRCARRSPSAGLRNRLLTM
jgi:hypothetical protein